MVEEESEDGDEEVQIQRRRKGKQGKSTMDNFPEIKANISKTTVLRLSHISGMLFEMLYIKNFCINKFRI